MWARIHAIGLAMGSSRLVPAFLAVATVVVVGPLPSRAARGIVTGLSFAKRDSPGQGQNRWDRRDGNDPAGGS
jgi:hypothetical protein